MEFSHAIKGTNLKFSRFIHTKQRAAVQPAVPSPDGSLIAVQTATHLDIRSTINLSLIHSIQIPPRFRGANVRWSPIPPNSKKPKRIVLYNDNGARVENVSGHSGHAVIDRGSGGLGKIVNVDFGRTESEVLIFQEFGAKVTIWNLHTARSIDIKDPKFPSKGHTYRPGSRHFTLLSRSGPQDVLTLHALNSYTVIWTATLPTMDAQGLVWSPDGRFIALWDTPSVGCRVYTYTATGDLYRVYNGNSNDAANPDIELGVRSVSWSPTGDYLAIGCYDCRVRLLSTKTFSPLMYLDHTTPIHLTSYPDSNSSASPRVWHEDISGSSNRHYTPITQPISPPTTPHSSSQESFKETGISMLAFSPSGSLLATRLDTLPTTAWIWNIQRSLPTAVLIHRTPIKYLSWHPSIADLLLIQCAHEEGVLYFWDSSSGVPWLESVSTSTWKKDGGKLNVRWLPAPSLESKPAVLFGCKTGFCVGWPRGRDVIAESEVEENDGEEEDEKSEESLDSVYRVLTGRSPFKVSSGGNTEILVSDVLDETTEMDDTFAGRNGRVIAGGDLY
jgi:WD40 repeat protein